MSEKLSIEQVREYWTEQAQQHGQSHAASWSDRMVIDMEIREISRYLKAGDRVLDIGCANGYSTVRYATKEKIAIKGIDYIPEMIDQAKSRLCASPPPSGVVEFEVGDIMSLREPANSFDKAIVTRVLINLGDWNRQQAALAECIRIIKPGGVLLLSEATIQGWTQLNNFRGEWGLPPIPMPPFNVYIDEDRVMGAVHQDLELIKLANFASTYYVASRVVKPLLIQALGANINVADAEMHWNRWCAQLPAWGDYGTQKLFVFQKRIATAPPQDSGHENSV